MEPTASQKSLERLVSHKAMQMSSSTSCKMWMIGFFCGICITYLFLVALTPFKTGLLGTTIPVQGSSLWIPDSNANESYNSGSSSRETWSRQNSSSEDLNDNERVLMLYNAWTALTNPEDQNRLLLGEIRRTDVPHAPHLEDCQLNSQTNKRFDSYGENRTFPPWTLWRGLLGLELLRPSTSEDLEKEQMAYRNENGYPPWIVGSDEDNFPWTRKVQRDIWIHQHPQNCYDPNLQFLVADWERLPGFGIGAQLAGMSGLLAIAIKEKRILVTNYYNRADHDGCKGSSRSHWSCYFFLETSVECQKRAFDLMSSEEAWANGTITAKENYTSKEIWAGRVPRAWGEPWAMMQPTTEVGGSLLKSHLKMDRRWWRAQAVRYLMRFQSEYACHLLNEARHKAFGMQAAKMVIESLPAAWTMV